MLDGTEENPQDHNHKMRGTLLSPQEIKIVRFSPSQLEMKPISTSLAPQLSRVLHHTEQVASLPLGNYRDSVRHQSQLYMNINFSTQLEESSMHPISSPGNQTADSLSLTEEVSQLSTSRSRGVFPQQ